MKALALLKLLFTVCFFWQIFKGENSDQLTTLQAMFVITFYRREISHTMACSFDQFNISMSHSYIT